ncbi:integrator complex subunit 6 [Drosophila pseudoobscura]|uniref:Integrator complex subunit 6 n=1 Tax=Drosophila pseudoobscura pseudoobscura TaxID=46245 RepID=A0A6I8W773_DROPS|nr:integrator complex subunit 6 [Drosophila pseudoobscura]XP_033239149.1 integrator complex subunit 6 [Drosophila pseudoobscura]XP_033239150.1 integrator complex subunit 6 [Drosophila pseudoobscura]XP_033239151.1 integrator complex subunit 6 [Drosophila pseudoobscura]XP_033239152.1 integrator complex subunit 6 [Drosophila pseudoobscura]XP_033239153.1 integrator complex subunit 6 [Drosophila pseudoobscura]XP_033239154.1 integrator complex subunit 6 [Drosophila pseudoobscura]XP_033239155.1 int
MTIILFLVDTSSSMCQKAYVNGVQKTYLDIAKGAVETFLKYRQRTQDCLGDRYMLLTFEEPPANVKAGWKENHATFMNELKNLQSHGLTSMGESLRNAFDLLNLNRMQSGIDTYGQGRCPFYLEPSVIIVITDGGRYSYRNGVHQEIILPLSNQIPGTKFTKEPFRWDQRLFSLVLRMPGNKIDERVEGKVPHDDSPIERMCEVTGGRSYRVRSHYVLNQCIESLVQKVQPGVVLQFEPLLPKDSASSSSSSGTNAAGGGGGSATQQSSSGSSSASSLEPTPDIVFQPIKKMIYVQKHMTQKTFPIGYWPLPEPYWPDSKAITLPPRDAHPKLKIMTPAVDEPQLVRSFPVDKYEIEGCPLTLQILNKREMNKCWQVIVTNGMHGFELPFGYLKASPTFSQVHLYVLAYNYPALLPLLHDLIHKYNMSPPNDLMYKFNAYVRSIPPYYCPFLRKALVNINVPYQLLQFLLPENVDNYLSPTIANQLKHIKNTAKQDQENLCMKVYKQLKQAKPPYRQVETAKLCTGTVLRRDLVRHPLLRDTFAKLHAEIEPVENYTIVVPQLTHQSSAKTYRNPFDIPRRDLVEEIARMRETFLRPTLLVAKDSGHCLPISEMGNYQEYLKNKDNPLREIEPTNVRQHMFGNPYKKDKHMVMVDEADLSDVAPMKSPNGNGPGGSPPGSSGSGSSGSSSSGSSSSGGPGGPGMGGGPGGMSGLMLGPHSGSGFGKKLDGTSRGRKRKAGPLPRAFEFRRVSTDSRSSCSSPRPSSASESAPSSPNPAAAIACDSSASPSAASTSSGSGSGLTGSGPSSVPGSGGRSSPNCFDEDSNSSFVSSSSSTDLSSDSGLSLSTSERLGGIGFDFSEEETNDQDTALNGHVHNFINGISDETNATDTEAPPGPGPRPGAPPPSNMLPAAAPAAPEPIVTATSVPVVGAAAAAPQATVTSTASGVVVASTVAASLVTPPPLPAVSSTSNGGLGLGSGGTGGSSSDPSCSSASANNSSGVLYVPLNGVTTTHAAYSSNRGGSPTCPMGSHLGGLGPAGSHGHKGISLMSLSGVLPMLNGYTHHGVNISPPSPLSAVPPAPLATPNPTTAISSSIGSVSGSSGSSYFTHNDINDASEISRILQTCHNGTSGSSGSGSGGTGGVGSGSGSGSGSTLNGNGSPEPDVGDDSESPLSLGIGNNFDALKRLAGGGAASSPHLYWGSGLNHFINNNNNSSSGAAAATGNSSTNNHRNHNNNSPMKMEIKSSPSCSSSPTHNSNSNSNSNGEVSAAALLILSEEQREAARKHNIDLRLKIFRDIRRPGRDYSQLLDNLGLVKGDHDMKSDFVEMCIGESRRFRRHRMVGSIQEWWEQRQQSQPAIDQQLQQDQSQPPQQQQQQEAAAATKS